MENAAVANVLRGEGYRYCHTNLAEAGIYYKYYRRGFHIVMAVDLSGGNRFSVQQYRSMEEHAMDLFYHPQGETWGFPGWISGISCGDADTSDRRRFRGGTKVVRRVQECVGISAPKRTAADL